MCRQALAKFAVYSAGARADWAQANWAGLKVLVDAGNPPGLIDYRGKVPVGWVSIGPREDYAKLKRSPVMKAVDGHAAAPPSSVMTSRRCMCSLCFEDHTLPQRS